MGPRLRPPRPRRWVSARNFQHCALTPRRMPWLPLQIYAPPERSFVRFSRYLQHTAKSGRRRSRRVALRRCRLRNGCAGRARESGARDPPGACPLRIRLARNAQSYGSLLPLAWWEPDALRLRARRWRRRSRSCRRARRVLRRSKGAPDHDRPQLFRDRPRGTTRNPRSVWKALLSRADCAPYLEWGRIAVVSSKSSGHTRSRALSARR